MSIEQLQSFVAVAEEGAIVRAARRLHLSQPPLTRRIQDLEFDLGATLFERGPRGVRLTRQGEELLPRARLILALVEQTRSALRSGADAPLAGVSGPVAANQPPLLPPRHAGDEAIAEPCAAAHSPGSSVRKVKA